MDMNKIGFQMSPEDVFKSSSKDLNYYTVNSLTWKPNMGDTLRANVAQELFKVQRQARSRHASCAAVCGLARAVPAVCRCWYWC
jgi:hypothetical protein